ncbi:hypothetical protein VTN96DRAFT_297 [Rasamsonia emersonii]
MSCSPERICRMDRARVELVSLLRHVSMELFSRTSCPSATPAATKVATRADRRFPELAECITNYLHAILYCLFVILVQERQERQSNALQVRG